MFKASIILGWLRWAVVAAVGLLVTTLFGLWLTAYSDEHKWFAHPSTQLAYAMSVAAAILGNPWFHWIGGAILGFAVGVWLDDLLRKKSAIEDVPSDLVRLPAQETKEQVKERNERRDAIRQARSLIAEATGSLAPMPEFSTMLQASYCYYKLRPHFSEQFRQMLVPNPRVVAVDGTGSPVPGLARALADELDRIEKEWGFA